jgi:hypothetical protein
MLDFVKIVFEQKLKIAIKALHFIAGHSLLSPRQTAAAMTEATDLPGF